MTTLIEALKENSVIASGTQLSDGTFKQETPVRKFYATVDFWKQAVVQSTSGPIVFQVKEPLTEEQLKKLANEVTWICGICRKGREHKHLACYHQVHDPVQWLKLRIWSDPRVQDMKSKI